MRCPDCNKFVGLETQEPEEQSEPSVTNNDDGTAQVTAEYTIDRNCADCSNLLKQATIELEAQVTLDDDKGDEEERGEDVTHEGHTLSVTDAEVSLVEDTYPKPKEVRNRKTGKKEMRYPKARYTRTLIGAEVTGTVHCDTCGRDVGSFSMRDTLPASSFDEQV